VTRRLVAILVTPPEQPSRSQSSAAPSDELRAAMFEDVYETVAMLELVEPVVVVAAEDPLRPRVQGLTWPGTPVLDLPAGDGPPGRRALQAVAGGSAQVDQLTVLVADAPDLPGLLVGKLHRALGSAAVAVLPAAGGGLVALATRSPLPPWLPDAGADLDADGALAALCAAAPRRTSVSVGPGWHRVRATDDVRHLDPGLEGWEVTRALLWR
jgi:hypothetical protein